MMAVENLPTYTSLRIVTSGFNIFFDNLTQEKFLTPEWIQQFKDSICSAPILMVDANLIPPALEASCQSTSKRFLLPIYLLTEIVEFFTLPIIIDSPLFSYPYLCFSVAAKSSVPVWFEPVSVAKSKRVASVAKYVSSGNLKKWSLLCSKFCSATSFCAARC